MTSDLLTTQRPLSTGAAAVFPYSERLEHACQRLSNFDQPYNLSRAAGAELWLPRESVHPGAEDARSNGEEVYLGARFEPRNEDQQRVFGETSKHLLAGRSFLVQAPTGWGKTYLGCAAAAVLQRRTLIVVTKDDAVTQWATAVQSVLDVTPAVWRADMEPGKAPVVIGLVQSLSKGPERYPNVDWASFGLVMVDEAHRMSAEHFQQAMWWLPARWRLGLTATRHRKDGKDDVFMGHLGEFLVEAELETMVPKVLIRKTGWRRPEVWQWRNGVPSYGPLQIPVGRTTVAMKYLCVDAERNAIVTSFLKSAVARGRHTLVFSDTVRHLVRLANAAHRAGIPREQIGFYVGTPAKVYRGKVKEQKHQRAKDTLKSVVFATYAMASEATDIPWMDACVLASPRADVMQTIGRVRRLHPGKPQPIVVDLVDEKLKIFRSYGKAREKWYASIGAEIVRKN